jgi:hypothetical protein
VPATLTDTLTKTVAATTLPALGAVKHNVTLYAPDAGVLVEQVETGGCVEVGVGVLVGVDVLVGVEVLVGVGVLVGAGVLVEVGLLLGVCVRFEYAGVADIESASTKIAITKKNMRLILMIFLPITFIGRSLTVPLPGLID